jgi:hypothetical protein
MIAAFYKDHSDDKTKKEGQRGDWYCHLIWAAHSQGLASTDPDQDLLREGKKKVVEKLLCWGALGVNREGKWVMLVCSISLSTTVDLGSCDVPQSSLSLFCI